MDHIRSLDMDGSPTKNHPSKLDEQMPTLVGQQRKKHRGPWGAGDRFDQQRSSRTFAGLEETFLEPRVAGSWIRFEWFHHTQKVSVKRTLEVLDGFGHSIWQKLHIFQKDPTCRPSFFASFLEISREQLATYSKRTDWKSVFSHPGGSWIFLNSWLRGIFENHTASYCWCQRSMHKTTTFHRSIWPIWLTRPSDAGGLKMIGIPDVTPYDSSRHWMFIYIYIYMIINIYI